VIASAHRSRSPQPQREINCSAARMVSIRRDIASSSESFFDASQDHRAPAGVSRGKPSSSTRISSRLKPSAFANPIRAIRSTGRPGTKELIRAEAGPWLH